MAILPNFFRLILPRKGSNQVRDLDTNWRTIEQWAEQVIVKLVAGSNITLTPSDGQGPEVTIAASGGSGGYASLTGPGQTVSPGKLTQEGNFEIDGGTTDTVTFDISGLVVPNTVIMDATRNLLIETSGLGGLGNITIAATATLNLTGPTAINIGNNSTGFVTILADNSSGVISLKSFLVNMGENTGGISFFATGGNTQQAITGSRGGNVALANLLTALASYGLIFDNTTP